ncbi:Na-translocating system protein MpsC family protein [Halobacillus campisalis]|uniref:Na-translocating system protein MpsC family protein n=1 Tax=Halobacillus campisalis TaxID=435909 RepID=A0ABW2K527_9BACI|nr:Na-translocating system protein MpsC family protein [Halobacillus campisalis]
MEKNSVHAEIASYTGKLFRDNFGKGPSSVYVSIEHPFITIYLSDFLAPMERVLVGQKNYMKVEETRDFLMQELLPEIKATLRVTADVDVENIYYDWSLRNKSGILVAVIKEENSEEQISDLSDYPKKDEVNNEIIRVSELAEKAPEKVESVYLNSRTLLVDRKGILVRIEKELINSGFSEQLRLSKRQLEKRLLDPTVFETILGTQIQDIFVDWDFSLDKSYIIFILKPK